MRAEVGSGVGDPRSLRDDLGRGWDAVVVDESAPGWSAESVLDQARTLEPSIPVLVVCEPARERAGLTLVERGAADCVASDRLARLPLAVRAAAEKHELTRRLARIEADCVGADATLDLAFLSSPEAIIALDPSTRVERWNPAAERQLGWREVEARGRNLLELVGWEEGRERLARVVAGAAGDLKARQPIVPVTLRRRDGQRSHFEVWATQRRIAPGALLFLTDVTERWRAEFLNRHQLGFLRALASPNEDGALAEALEQIGLSVHGVEARLWETDARGGLQLRAAWHADDAAATSAPEEPPAHVRHAMTGGVLSFSEAGAASPLGEWIGVPVVSGRQVLGALEIRAPDFPGFSDAYAAHLTSLGSYLGLDLAGRRSQIDFARSLDELHRSDRERRRLMRLLVEAHEDERKTIAADIHDDPLQVMAAVALRLHSLRRRLDDEPARHTLEVVEEMVSSAVSRMRSMMFNLRPPGLDHGDLIGPLRDRLEGMRQDEMIEYSLVGSEPPALTTEARVALYRIAQEAIANVIKHASATRVDVTVDAHEGGCLMRIADDGAGLGGALDGRGGHLGLPTMRERTELAGGWLRVEEGQVSGTMVSAWVPVPSESRNGQRYEA